MKTVLIAEDDEHLIELFKNIKRINVELKGIEIYFSTDLRQLENEIDKTLLGGVKILIDGKIIDASVKSRVEALAEAIK